jgi:hypothetical protein
MEPRKGGIVGPTIFFSKRQIELLKGVVASIKVTQLQQATAILNEHNVERINKVQSLQSNDVRGRRKRNRPDSVAGWWCHAT